MTGVGLQGVWGAGLPTTRVTRGTVSWFILAGGGAADALPLALLVWGALVIGVFCVQVCSRKKTPTRGSRTTETAPRLCSLRLATRAPRPVSFSLSVLAVGTSSLSLSCHGACGVHSLRLWLPGCCLHSEQSTVSRSRIFRESGFHAPSQGNSHH